MKRSMVPFFRAGGLALAALLAGCAETALVVDQAKVITKPSEQATGGYKIGKPYQVGGVWYYPAVDYEYDETGVASWYGPGFDGKMTANGEIYDMNGLTAAHRTLPMPSMVRVTNLENGRALTLRVTDRGPFAHGRIIDVSRRAAQLLGFEQQGTAKVRVEILAEESLALAMQAGAGKPGAPALPGEPKPQAAPAIAVASETLPPPGGVAAAPARASSPPPAADHANVTSKQIASVAPLIPEGQVTVQPVRPTQLFIQAGAFVDYQNANRLSARLSPLGRSEVSPTFVGGQQFFRVRLGPIASVEEADRLLEQVINAGHADARLTVQ